jgi:hypothetical protein
MAWSIFSSGDPTQWAHQLLAAIGAPESAANLNFFVELAEA